MIYNIQPIEIAVGTKTTICSTATFNQGYTAFSQEMSFSWVVYDADGRTAYMSGGTVGSDVLAGWGTDDEYIVNAMATEAGVVVIWS